MALKTISTPIKPSEASSITHEENDEIHNKLSKLDEQLNDLSARSVKSDDLVNSQRKIQEMENKMDEMENNMEENKNDMKNKMDENKYEIQKSMKELQNSMSYMIFQDLNDRLFKGDIIMQGNHENISII
jgi:DNA repair exonuclease SbcCD ATPase subunit